MEIIRGKIPCAKKVVCYGPEGIGKSTFASKFPEPLFIDTEGGTKDMDVARTPAPSSWEMLLGQVEYVRTHPDICRTLVVDTVDWAEQMCVERICSKHQKDGLESFGYGTGYVYVREEFGRFLNRLSEVVDTGIHVVLTAHAQMRKFEQPDEMGAYDRWELKLGKKTSSQTSPLVKEWSDILLFANYKTFSIAVDDKGKKRKAQGGSRVMYTAHHPCWDAKNRYGLPEEMEFDYAGIAHIIEGPASIGTKEEVNPEVQFRVPDNTVQSAGMPDVVQALKKDTENAAGIQNIPTDAGSPGGTDKKNIDGTIWESNPANVPKALKDLMEENNVSEWDVQNVVAARGYYPSDVRIENYDPDFIAGVLVGAWGKVFEMIRTIKETQEIPFN